MMNNDIWGIIIAVFYFLMFSSLINWEMDKKGRFPHMKPLLRKMIACLGAIGIMLLGVLAFGFILRIV